MTVSSAPEILVVRKTTNFEWYGSYIREQVERGRMPSEDISRLKLAHDEHYASLERLRNALTAASLPYDELSRESPWPTQRRYRYIFTVGGDGTLLTSSHHVDQDTVIIGVRSSTTSVGWLCGVQFAAIDEVVEQLKSGTLPIVNVARMQAEVERVATGQILRTQPVLNDLLFCNANPAATTRYRLQVGKELEGQKSSGIWVSTATGSTAAIHAAGGQTMQPLSRDFQYYVREVMRIGAPKYRLTGAVFDPDAAPLAIENRNEDGILALDGQHGVIELALGDRVRILRGPDLRIVRKSNSAVAVG